MAHNSSVRITLVISSLEAGGAERVATTQANYWASKGWIVTVITCTPRFQESFYDLHPAVRHINVDFGSLPEGIYDSIRKNLRRNFALRKAIIDSRPDYVISHLIRVNIRTLIASIGLNLPVIVTEHGWPAYSGSVLKWDQLRSITYSWASAIVTPNLDLLKYFSKSIRQKGIEIPNPVVVEQPEITSASAPALPGSTNIAAIGRLERVKRFDLLLEAFAEISSDSGCFLNIVGDGPLQGELVALAGRLGIEKQVCFWGFIKNPWHLLRKADMLVLSSEFECFPMVLLEAMACSIPVVSFDCPIGPRKIIRDGIDGVLVPPLDVRGLARAIEKVLNNDEERRRLGLAAAKSAERFSVDRIMKQWEDLLEGLIQRER